MSLYRVSGIYYVDLAHGQGRIRRSTGTADRKEAQEYHDTLENQLWREAKLGERAPVTWSQAVGVWLDREERGMPDKYRLRALDIPLQEKLPFEVEQTEGYLAGMSGATFNRTLAIIVAIHNVNHFPPPKVPRRKTAPGRTRWLDAAEWKRLQACLRLESPLLEQAARFALATGLRENNVLNLEWSQIDLKRRQATIHADQMKQGVPLGVPLTDAAMAVLAERKGTHKQWVFAHPDSGKPLYKASNRAWYNALKKAKLYDTGVNWHTLRHTWASWHIMGGTRIEELMRLGGWASLSMVQRYAHLATEHLASIAEQSKPVSRKRYNAPRNAKTTA